MKPRKTRNTYSVYIGIPSMGRIAVLPSYKEAQRVAAFYNERRIRTRIVTTRRKVVVAP